ncbi:MULTISPECIES: PleD family two-component system response regulator [Myxococcaceae]|uniref:response regulator n=1 Tax=Myxococcaceae TaxID=31 RepID=UPI00188E61A4|nr:MULTISPECIES: response regulator [Myxococcaceae]MBF5045775.1 response regulator [Simulacricoccus sp. 17bor-14]
MSAPKVLIADDDEVMLRALERQALKHGLRPITASEGQVLELALEHRPAVVVLDIHQRGFDGRDVLAQLKRAPEMRRTEVVVISGQEEPSTQAECLMLGAAAFQRKPVEWSFMEEVARLARQVSAGASEASWLEAFGGGGDLALIEIEESSPSSIEVLPWVAEE